MKCDNCNKAATVHLTEIRGGKKIEKHLCEQCAAASEGLPVKAHTPINELLTNFVMAHSGLQKEMGTTCEQCGITWAEFRQHGLFGCEHDYDLFEKDLAPLLQRAHEAATSGQNDMFVGDGDSQALRSMQAKQRLKLTRRFRRYQYRAMSGRPMLLM